MTRSPHMTLPGPSSWNRLTSGQADSIYPTVLPPPPSPCRHRGLILLRGLPCRSGTLILRGMHSVRTASSLPVHVQPGADARRVSRQGHMGDSVQRRGGRQRRGDEAIRHGSEGHEGFGQVWSGGLLRVFAFRQEHFAKVRLLGEKQALGVTREFSTRLPAASTQRPQQVQSPEFNPKVFIARCADVPLPSAWT